MYNSFARSPISDSIILSIVTIISKHAHRTRILGKDYSSNYLTCWMVYFFTPEAFSHQCIIASATNVKCSVVAGISTANEITIHLNDCLWWRWLLYKISTDDTDGFIYVVCSSGKSTFYHFTYWQKKHSYVVTVILIEEKKNTLKQHIV